MWFQIRGTGGERRLHAGPVWDFDIAAGNFGYNIFWDFSPQGNFARRAVRWFYHMANTPEIAEKIYIRWQQIADREVRAMINLIYSTARTHQAAFERNHERWRECILHIHHPQPVLQIGTDFMGQVNYLIWWLEERIIWLNGFLYV